MQAGSHAHLQAGMSNPVERAAKRSRVDPTESQIALEEKSVLAVWQENPVQASVTYAYNSKLSDFWCRSLLARYDALHENVSEYEKLIRIKLNVLFSDNIENGLKSNILSILLMKIHLKPRVDEFMHALSLQQLEFTTGERRNNIESIATECIPGVFIIDDRITFIADASPCRPDDYVLMSNGELIHEKKDAIINMICEGLCTRLPQPPSFYVLNSNYALRSANGLWGLGGSLFRGGDIPSDDNDGTTIPTIDRITTVYPFEYMVKFNDEKWNVFMKFYPKLRADYMDDDFSWILNFNEYYAKNQPTATVTEVADLMQDVQTDTGVFFVEVETHPRASAIPKTGLPSSSPAPFEGQSFYLTFLVGKSKVTTEPTTITTITQKRESLKIGFNLITTKDHESYIMLRAGNPPLTNVTMHRHEIETVETLNLFNKVAIITSAEERADLPPTILKKAEDVVHKLGDTFHDLALNPSAGAIPRASAAHAGRFNRVLTRSRGKYTLR